MIGSDFCGLGSVNLACDTPVVPNAALPNNPPKKPPTKGPKGPNWPNNPDKGNDNENKKSKSLGGLTKGKTTKSDDKMNPRDSFKRKK